MATPNTIYKNNKTLFEAKSIQEGHGEDARFPKV